MILKLISSMFFKNQCFRPIILTTEYQGVFYGFVKNTKGLVNIDVKDCRMIIEFGSKTGLFELALTGPTSDSVISARADAEIRKVSSVIEVTEKSAERWREVS